MSINDLAAPDEPFHGSAANAFTEIPNARRAQEQIARVRMTLAELPLPTKAMNAVSVVLMYTLVGISKAEIATATGMSLEQVERIQSGDAYQKMHSSIVESILDEDSDDVRTLLAAHSKAAARRVVSLVQSGDEVVALAAAKDTLDRSGHRPADRVIVEGMGQLTIRVIHDEKSPPTLDITPKE